MNQFLNDWGFIIWLGFIAALFTSRIIARCWNGKNVFRPKFDNPTFEETWRSGVSSISRFGGVYSFLWMVDCDIALHVGPHFPFNLFAPDSFRLEFDIPGERIIGVEKVNRFLGRPKIRIEFRRDLIGEEDFEIGCKRPDDLIAAINEI